jgi:cytochrome c-type biogenesis protein
MIGTAVAEGVPLALAFSAGLVATVNPCGFAMLPSLVSYYLGGRVSREDGPRRVAEGLVVGLVLTAGFMVVFGAVGAVLAAGARSFLRYVPWVTIAIGAMLVGLGVWLVAGRHLVVPIPGLRAPEGLGYRSMFAFGMAYAVGSLSCTLPVFMVVMGAGLAAGSFVGTLGVFLAYGLGMSAVLMLLCLGTAGFREYVVRRIRPLLRHMSRVSGVLLILGGGYVIYYWVTLLSGGGESGPIRWMQRLQERAQDFLLRPGQRLWLGVGIALLATAAVVAVTVVRARGDRAPERPEEPTEGEALEEAGVGGAGT